MNVVLVGIGGYGDVYLSALLGNGIDGVAFVAGVDPAPQRCGRLAQLRAAGVKVFPSLTALYDAGLRPDLVVLATPLHLHADQATFAMEHGSHVLCEKPLAATPEDAARMAAVRDRTGRHLAVGYQWAYAPGIRRLKHDLNAGRFGRPLSMRTRVYWPRDSAYYDRNGWAGRQRTADGRAVFDSPLNNACAHFVQNMLFLLGDAPATADWPAEVTAELYRAHPIENYDTVALRCRTRTGVELFAALSHVTEGQLEPAFEYRFERGTVVSDASLAHHVIARADDGQTIDYGPQPLGNDVTKLGATIEAIRRGDPPACPAEAAAAHTALMLAAQRSAEPIAFPADLVRVSGPDGRRTVAVRGLDGVLDHCYDALALPAELGVPWAAAGRPVRVDPPATTATPGVWVRDDLRGHPARSAARATPAAAR